MARTQPVMTRVSSTLKKKLKGLAKQTDRSESYLAAEAIAAYVDVNAWQVEQIKKGLDEARSGVPGVLHEDVEAWVRSWGTRKERKRPAPKA
jgi:RHH-type rel operon transcriptional repressor/antitoxin RelB